MTDKRWFAGGEGQIVVAERDVHDNSAIIRQLDLQNVGTFWNVDLGQRFKMPHAVDEGGDFFIALETHFPDIREIDGPEDIPVIYFRCLSHEEWCEEETPNVWAICNATRDHLASRNDPPIGTIMPIKDVPSGTTLCGIAALNLFRMVHGSLSLKDDVYLGSWVEAAKFRACEIVQMRIMHPDRWSSRESALSDYFAGHDFSPLDRYRLAHCYLGEQRSFAYLSERMFDCKAEDQLERLRNIQHVLDVRTQFLSALPSW